MLHTDRELLDHYVHARGEQADYFAERCVEIADAAISKDFTGVAAARVRIEAQKWRAGVLKPKVYGNKAEAKKRMFASRKSTTEYVARGREQFALLRARFTGFAAPNE